ncbi:MAG: nitroreductase [Cellvibrionales bacterium]|nr:nitroreductase [Cellvibrionales bacterium]
MSAETLIQFIQSRNAHAKLIAPAPNAHELQQVFSAAYRAPDHAKLTPARFRVIEGEGLHALGALFVEVNQIASNHPLSESEKQSILKKPLRAPMIIVASCEVQAHEKVPEIEQMLSAGCSVQNLLLSIEALGYGAIWRTGNIAFDPKVHAGLGFSENEKMLGFIYIGTKEGKAKTIKPVDYSGLVSRWPAE